MCELIVKKTAAAVAFGESPSATLATRLDEPLDHRPTGLGDPEIGRADVLREKGVSRRPKCPIQRLIAHLHRGRRAR